MENYKELIRKQHSVTITELKSLENSKHEYKQIISNLLNFRDRLSCDIMVPIPSNKNPIAFMKGTALHTNELLVPLGAKYFVKMTASDTIEYCRRKCENIDRKQEDFLKEHKLFMERIAFINSQNFGEKELVETYNDDEEKRWRERHIKNVKKMKLKEAVERQKINEQSADYYFSRLEELEQEELEAEEL